MTATHTADPVTPPTVERLRALATEMVAVADGLDPLDPEGKYDAGWLASKLRPLAVSVSKFADDAEFDPDLNLESVCTDCGEDLDPYITVTRYREPSDGLCGRCAWFDAEAEK